ncbi:NAD(P)H-binding protein [Actimicrobium antarcticum]|uniref:Semialdehyde dehydrogenase NAD-binding domain-containing protein n=1 Tax=Actimicrobium antarcticum TaxID=1051899 RepID=A0ABP7T1G7_9BURK
MPGACVVGATGLVGRALVAQLVQDKAVDAVHLMVRRVDVGFAASGQAKVVQHVIDFDQIAQADWPACEVLFCCLGTTIKTAGSQAAFRRVDVDYVIASARRARQTGATQLAVVSALGASPTSDVFYNRIKGEMEGAVASLGFHGVTIVRPSLLDGDRKEMRPAERVALLLMKIGKLFVPKKYRAVTVAAVASALRASAQLGRQGVHIIESDQLQTA